MEQNAVKEVTATVYGGTMVDQCLETIHVKDGCWWIEQSSGNLLRQEISPEQARAWLEEHGCTDALKEFGFEGGELENKMDGS